MLEAVDAINKNAKESKLDKDFIKKMEPEDSPLIDAKLIEHTNDNGFINKESFKVTEQAKCNLLGELNLKSVKITLAEDI